ncbi:lycopene cyclase domain-containing protein [Luteimicrobium subarcticum]|uniref:Lycopene cyclase domain-containing protein n=1 Tax=Luteimicrobium subarcticum TaxID=620910 RepID=A0A2M8WTI1_9MICO|nr:lycopene cyclase domain-containing protein [Luteimicrobium subarcticum]PJI94184.1 lycopene cyclase domain-containing protein [Luteimicrobium subarcticum]
MRFAYLAALLVSLAGVAVVDARWRLVLWRDARRGAVALGVGLAAFLLWDGVCIAAGVFVRGDGRWSTGVEVAPHLPLEEPVFLLFLCYLALVLWTAARRVERAVRARAAEPARDAAPARDAGGAR